MKLVIHILNTAYHRLRLKLSEYALRRDSKKHYNTVTFSLESSRTASVSNTFMLESLLNFLESKTLNVAVLKGDWGVGKTFYWRKFLKENNDKIHFKGYSYVSLFGINSISDLRKQIFSNFQALDESGLAHHTEKLKPIISLLKSVKIPYLNSSSVVSDYVESKFIEDFLICFDDLERKESQISITSILGLISQLKEEKNCKIILIYNEECLKEEDQNVFNQHREKIVDIELRYKPTISDNINIIWPEGCPASIREIFEELQLNNIRVMQRVRWAQEYFKNRIHEAYPNLLPTFERNTAILTIVYYVYSHTLSLDEALNTSYLSLLISKDPDKDKRCQILKTLSYSPQAEDVIIRDYLVNGFIDDSQYTGLLKSGEEQDRRDAQKEAQTKIWRKYTSNFITSESDFISEMIHFLEVNSDDLNISEIAYTVEFLEKLDVQYDFSEMLNRSIDLLTSKAERINLRERRFDGLKPDLIKRIQENFEMKKKDIPLRDLLNSLAGDSGWNPRDLSSLMKFSEDDYYDWIITEKEFDTIGILACFLQRFCGDDENEKSAVERIVNALERIKRRSSLDRFRVEYLIQEKPQKVM